MTLALKKLPLFAFALFKFGLRLGNISKFFRK